MSSRCMYGGVSADSTFTVYLIQDTGECSNSANQTDVSNQTATTVTKTVSIERTDSLDMKATDLCVVDWRLVVLRKEHSDSSKFGIETPATTCYKDHICTVCSMPETSINVLKCLCIRQDCPDEHCTVQIEDNIIGVSSTDKLLFLYTGTGSLWFISDIRTPSPERIVLSNKKVRQVACGKEHTVMLTTLGQVYTFGGGSRGQLGHGDLESLKEPRIVEALSGIYTAAVSAGGWHNLILSDIGDVYSWGWNESGQVGLPCLKDEHSVTKTGTHDGHGMVVHPSLLFEDNEDITIVDISCGSRHSAAITDDGILYTWGWNYYGQLFISGETIIQDTPRLIGADGTRFSTVRCGGWSTFAFF